MDSRIAVTGLEWIGKGASSIVTTMRDMISGAEDEIMITAYSITPGADVLVDMVGDAAARGVSVKFIINNLKEQPTEAKKRLKKLSDRHRHFKVFDFHPSEREDLHAKVVVVDRSKALVGSSNLSRRGLKTNHELAALVSGEEAHEVASLIDRLGCSLIR